MLNARIDDTTDAKVFVLVLSVENALDYVAQVNSDTLRLCQEPKNAEWFTTEDAALDALHKLCLDWYIGRHFRIAKYYMLKEVLCLL